MKAKNSGEEGLPKMGERQRERKVGQVKGKFCFPCTFFR